MQQSIDDDICSAFYSLFYLCQDGFMVDDPLQKIKMPLFVALSTSGGTGGGGRGGYKLRHKTFAVVFSDITAFS